MLCTADGKPALRASQSDPLNLRIMQTAQQRMHAL